MARIDNATLFWVKCDPARPEAAFGDGGPKWSVQIRTRDKNVQQAWKDLGIKMKPETDDNGIYYHGSLRRPVTNREGKPNDPPKVMDGALHDIDPNIIGNNSVANIQVFTYDYEVKSKTPGGASLKGKGVMLKSIQVTKLVKYEPKPRDDDFEMTDTEIIEPVAQAEGSQNQTPAEGVGEPDVDPNF